MGLFSKKPKVDSSQFCQDMYERFVFAPEIGGRDPHLLYSQTVLDQVSEADPKFRHVSFPELADELLALRLEVIGTAWSHKTKDKPALDQSEFTKLYLADSGWGELWEQMGAYNQAVAQSATYGADTNTRVGRARVTFINQMRTQVFDRWIQEGRDHEAAARVANRTGSEEGWKSGVSQGLLALELTRRLGHEGSDIIWSRLAAVAEGFYRGAVESLSEVKITA